MQSDVDFLVLHHLAAKDNILSFHVSRNMRNFIMQQFRMHYYYAASLSIKA